MFRVTIRWLWILGILIFPVCLQAAENARIKIILYEVSTEPEIETQIFVSWGAKLKFKPARLKRYNFYNKGNRPTGTISHKTETVEIDSEVTSFIVYGIIREHNGEIIRFIPAKFFDIGNTSPSQLEIAITPRRNFDEAFLDSYPLEFKQDRGFLNTQNVGQTLRSLRHMIDYSGEIDAQVSNDVWNRVHTFFQVNRCFFRRGGSNELSEVLEYLKTYTAASRRDGVANFYAEFLNGLISDVRGIDVFQNEKLTDYIHAQLMLLYENRLNECFSQADISLSKYRTIRQYEKSLTLATKILQTLEGRKLNQVIQKFPKNLFSVLLETTLCGQEYFVEKNKPNATPLHSDDGARFLATSSIGRKMISEYLRVCKVMISNCMLSLDSTGDGYEIAKFYMAYKRAHGG